MQTLVVKVCMDDFAQMVRDRRIREGLSQQDLAEKVGISRNYLSQIERGQATNLSWQVRERLSALLGLQSQPQPSVAPEPSDLPPTLLEFAQKANLPPDDLLMLSRLKYRGQQPTSAEKWELLYNVIKMTMG